MITFTNSILPSMIGLSNFNLELDEIQPEDIVEMLRGETDVEVCIIQDDVRELLFELVPGLRELDKPRFDRRARLDDGSLCIVMQYRGPRLAPGQVTIPERASVTFHEMYVVNTKGADPHNGC